MKEKLQEIYEGLQERLKSPFLLTFLVIWSIHNWELVYAVFTFEESLSFVKRYSFIKSYIKVYGNYHILWFPLMWSFISLAIYLIASFLSEGINLIYSKWIRTTLYWLIDRNKLKTEADYEDLEKRRMALQDLVHDLKRKEEDASVKLNSKEKQFKEDYDKLLLEKIDSAAKIDELEKSLAESEKSNRDLLDVNEEKEAKLNELQELKLKIEKLESDNSSLEKFKIFAKQKIPIVETAWLNNNFEILLQQDSDSKFFHLFKESDWLNQYNIPNGEKGKEIFSISESIPFRFIVQNKPDFVIQNVVFSGLGELNFTKVNSKTKREINVSLDISNRDKLVGWEDNNIPVSYSRVL